MPSGRKSRSAEVERLRARSAQLFTELLTAEYPSTKGRKAAAASRAMVSRRTGRPNSFSWFDPDDAAKATALAAELAITTGAATSTAAGLSSALDLAQARASEEPPALVRQALAMFVTHHKPARQLSKPRSVVARPEAFVRSKVGTTGKASKKAATIAARGSGRGSKARTLGSTTEAQLDYWREDALANEHHEHWHEVYPFSGLFPPTGTVGSVGRQAWPGRAPAGPRAAASEPVADVRELSAAAEIAQAFLTRANTLVQQGRFGQFLQQLAAEPYRALLRLNDRQGELFVYMHRQMLARYDAERLSGGCRGCSRSHRRSRRPPPTATTRPPADVPARPAGRKLVTASSTQMVQLQTTCRRRDGEEVRRTDRRGRHDRLARTSVRRSKLLTAVARPAARRSLRRAAQHRSWPHRRHLRADESERSASGRDERPAAAIRDPIFWRWHKNIDDLGVLVGAAQPAMSVRRRAGVRIRVNGPTASRTVDQPRPPPGSSTKPKESTNAVAPASRTALDGHQRRQGDHRQGSAEPRGLSLHVASWARVPHTRAGGTQTKYLTHLPFGYAMRIDNPKLPQATRHAARVRRPSRSAPTTDGMDRDGQGRGHAARPQSTRSCTGPTPDFAVVKRPAETIRARRPATAIRPTRAGTATAGGHGPCCFHAGDLTGCRSG